MKTKKLDLLFSVVALLLALTACATRPGTSVDPTPLPLSNGVQEVGGIVLSGGESTPEDLLDAPRTFIYQVKLDSGEEIYVSYCALPPSPARDAQPGIKLNFYAGEIKPGDYLTARGLYDPATHTLTVSGEGDFIETFKEKP